MGAVSFVKSRFSLHGLMGEACGVFLVLVWWGFSGCLFFAWLYSRLSSKCYSSTRFTYPVWRTSDLLLNSTQTLIMSFSGVSSNTPGRACICTTGVSSQSPSDWVPYLCQKVKISNEKKGKDSAFYLSWIQSLVKIFLGLNIKIMSMSQFYFQWFILLST